MLGIVPKDNLAHVCGIGYKRRPCEMHARDGTERTTFLCEHEGRAAIMKTRSAEPFRERRQLAWSCVHVAGEDVRRTSDLASPVKVAGAL